ncbi:sulfurtransferase [Rhodobacteraceae bacterium KMM 6894]|nr:sulfurtransferase [Rhodobacteraceae bacterium KMM 6894]
MLRRTLGAALLGASLTLAVTLPALAADAPEDPKNQTPWGLYLTAKEAFDMKTAQGDGVLFIDVREPIEIMFTGFTDTVDLVVPYMQVDPTAWHPEKPRFEMRLNPDFAAGVKVAMDARDMGVDTPVILMCRSGGTRGAPSAKALEGLGLKSVYVVVDGFEGATSKDNPNGPWRLKNGWKNSGLPWSYDMNKDKIPLRAQ